VTFLGAFVLPLQALAQLPSSPGQTQEQTPPATPPATDTSAPDPCTSGKTDAKHYNSPTGYMVFGFLCGIFGFIAAAASSPEPPADRVVGKDYQWVQAYTDCYRKQAKSANQSAACSGWALGSATTLAIYAAQGGF
jgi:hypothetical protein